MGVAPGGVGDAVAIAASDVHATGVADGAVDDDYFAVGAAVDVAGEHGGDEFEEGLEINIIMSLIIVMKKYKIKKYRKNFFYSLWINSYYFTT